MAVAVCRSSPTTPFRFDALLEPAWPEKTKAAAAVQEDDQNIPRQGQFDIWSSIQSQKPPAVAGAMDKDLILPPYVHPLMRRSPSLLSEKSLEICTESLGSETGSDGFSSSLSDMEIDCDSLDSGSEELGGKYYHERATITEVAAVAKLASRSSYNELVSVNYHCSASRRSPPRSFPPPLPSISRRDGPCLQMRPHRRDGRLVVEAVHVPSHNYLHAQRQGGRLLLSFIEAAPIQENTVVEETKQREEPEEEEEGDEEEEELEEEEEEMEEEEEVEVVDRGTVVEVKVSTQPQQLSGAMKVHRSSLVINKFVGGTPQMSNQTRWPEIPVQCHQELPTLRRTASITTTTSATSAVVAASTLLTDGCDTNNNNNNNNKGDLLVTTDNKMLFTSKRRNKEDLLHHMRRCSQLRRPLFIWEPCYITTSS